MIDARHFQSPFKRMSRALTRLFPLDFSNLVRYPEGFGELKGRYGHVLKDGEDGWVVGSADDVQSFPGGVSVGASKGYFDKLGTLYHAGWAIVKSTFNIADPDPDDFYAYCTVQEVNEVMTTIMNLGAASTLTVQQVVASDATVANVSVNKVMLTDAGEETGCELSFDEGLSFDTGVLYSGTLSKLPPIGFAAEHLVDCRLTALSDWAQSATGPGLTLAESKTDALAMGLVPLGVGSVVHAWSLAGTYVEAAAFSGSARLYARSAAGADTAIGDAVTLVEETGAFTASHTLATAHEMVAGSTYFVKVTATTGAGDSAVLSHVLVDVR